MSETALRPFSAQIISAFMLLIFFSSVFATCTKAEAEKACPSGKAA